ncbi:hypothetical protein DFH27DRAFT_547991 [Peziza echinospora]|nr:hypothetical protein DFH27DRAFT_547991 [Peziza echinospora]
MNTPSPIATRSLKPQTTEAAGLKTPNIGALIDLASILNRNVPLRESEMENSPTPKTPVEKKTRRVLVSKARTVSSTVAVQQTPHKDQETPQNDLYPNLEAMVEAQKTAELKESKPPVPQPNNNLDTQKGRQPLHVVELSSDSENDDEDDIELGEIPITAITQLTPAQQSYLLRKSQSPDQQTTIVSPYKPVTFLILDQRTAAGPPPEVRAIQCSFSSEDITISQLRTAVAAKVLVPLTVKTRFVYKLVLGSQSLASSIQTVKLHIRDESDLAFVIRSSLDSKRQSDMGVEGAVLIELDEW